MNLLQLRTEVLAHGFDPVQYGSRVNQYLNDAQSLIARRANYYIEESTYQFSTVASTDAYPLASAANFARARSLFDTNRRVEMLYVSTRQIDRSANTLGTPAYYTIDGQNIRLYPMPDGVYPMELRYWLIPTTLVNDTDTPVMPADWHKLLWYYAVSECYSSDDDMAAGGQWMQKFTEGLAEFEADQKFPDTDGPSQAADMWGGDDSLGTSNAWTRFGFGA